MNEEEYTNAKKYALRRIAMRSQSSGRMREAILKKNISDEVTDQILKEFTQSGYLNDAEFAKRLIEREAARCRGPHWIKHKLIAQGIDRSTAEHFLDKYYPRDLQIERAKELRLKKKVINNAHFSKILYKNGFDYDIINI